MSFLFPSLISFFTFLVLWQLVFLIFLPNEIFLLLIPLSFLWFLFDWILVLNHTVNLSSFDSWKIIKLCALIWIFLCWNILRMIFEIFFSRFFNFLVKLYSNSFNKTDWYFLTIFLFSISLKLLYFFLIKNLFPSFSIFLSQSISFLSILNFMFLLFSYLLYCCQKWITLDLYIKCNFL